MKFFSSELGQNYETYTFGYANYCQLEQGDALSDIYNLGYLPYSGSKDTKGVFYFARSGRVVLNEFKLTSENRRVAKKFDGQFEKQRTPLSEFSITDRFLDFCLDYFAKKHGPSVMPRERLELILSFGIISTVITYHKDGKVVGYVFEVADPAMGHYWYSFYDPSMAGQSLGVWLMLDCIRDAKAAGRTYYYLGTVYGGKTIYKMNFGPLEWWDGTGWSRDSKALKDRGGRDASRGLARSDVWKKEKKGF